MSKTATILRVEASHRPEFFVYKGDELVARFSKEETQGHQDVSMDGWGVHFTRGASIQFQRMILAMAEYYVNCSGGLHKELPGSGLSAGATVNMLDDA